MSSKDFRENSQTISRKAEVEPDTLKIFCGRQNPKTIE